MNGGGAYGSYWERKRLLAGPLPQFPVRRWWPTDALSEIEQICFDAVRGAPSLLDVGAGDLRVREKFRRAGYAGEYHTLDIGGEYEHTYGSLAEVGRPYDALLCLDVLEHMPLEAALEAIDRMVSVLAPGGTLVIQTPNARCIRNPLAWDMTHVHCFNIADLWAYLSAAGLRVEAYRVVFTFARRGVAERVRAAAAAFVTSRLLGMDYADNLVLIGRKDPA